jgi:hypothetical protein
VIAWHTLTMKPGPMMMNLIQAYESTGVSVWTSVFHTAGYLASTSGAGQLGMLCT